MKGSTQPALHAAVERRIADWLRWVAEKTGRSGTDIGGTAFTRAMKPETSDSMASVKLLCDVAYETGLPLPDLNGTGPAVPGDLDRELLSSAVAYAVTLLDLPDPDGIGAKLTENIATAYASIGEQQRIDSRRIGVIEATKLAMSDRPQTPPRPRR